MSRLLFVFYILVNTTVFTVESARCVIVFSQIQEVVSASLRACIPSWKVSYLSEVTLCVSVELQAVLCLQLNTGAWCCALHARFETHPEVVSVAIKRFRYAHIFHGVKEIFSLVTSQVWQAKTCLDSKHSWDFRLQHSQLFVSLVI